MKTKNLQNRTPDVFYLGGVNRWISALMVLILILLSACKKESITHERFNTELTSSNNLNLKSLDSISVRVIDNVMHFADAHAADAALDYLNIFRTMIVAALKKPTISFQCEPFTTHCL